MYTNRKLFIAKCVIAVSILYLFVYVGTNKSATHIIRQLQQSGRNLAALDPQQNPSVDVDSLSLPDDLAAIEKAIRTNATLLTVKTTTTTRKPLSIPERVKEVSIFSLNLHIC